MAKKTYVGVNNIARNVSKMYVGVNGVARKIKKAYVGVNGVAKLVFRILAKGFSLYSTNIISLTTTPSWMISYGEFNDKYWWVFTRDDNVNWIYINRFTKELTREDKSTSYGGWGTVYTPICVANDNYFYVHDSDVTDRSKTDMTKAINKTDTYSLIPGVHDGSYKSAVRAGEYVLFGGGSSYSAVATISYTKNTTISNTTSLSSTTLYLTSASFKDNSVGVFWGGERPGLTSANAFNGSVTRTLYNVGHTASAHPFGASLGENSVMFGGGVVVDSSGAPKITQGIDTCFSINKSGTKTNMTSLSTTSESKWLNGASYDNLVIIPISMNNIVDIYNDSLTKTTMSTGITTGTAFRTPGRIGEYLAISKGYSDTQMDLFTPTY